MHFLARVDHIGRRQSLSGPGASVLGGPAASPGPHVACDARPGAASGRPCAAPSLHWFALRCWVRAAAAFSGERAKSYFHFNFLLLPPFSWAGRRALLFTAQSIPNDPVL